MASECYIVEILGREKAYGVLCDVIRLAAYFQGAGEGCKTVLILQTPFSDHLTDADQNAQL